MNRNEAIARIKALGSQWREKIEEDASLVVIGGPGYCGRVGCVPVLAPELERYAERRALSLNFVGQEVDRLCQVIVAIDADSMREARQDMKLALEKSRARVMRRAAMHGITYSDSSWTQ